MLVYLPLLTIILGAGLYWVRCRFRFWYGIGELLVGVLIVVLTYIPHQEPILLAEDPSPPSWAPWAWFAVTWLAGLYVFVRGMDNIGQDLPLAWRPRWVHLFSPPTPPTPSS
jgi:hypothetical protein